MSRKPPLSNTFFLVSVALMAALGIVLTRVLRVDLGFARFSLGHMASIMAGLWLGPVGGALSGGIADVAGSFLQGYAPNPLITASAVMWGVIPALTKGLIRGSRARKAAVLSISICVTSVICTLGLTYAGLVMIGYDARGILPARLTQFAAMTPVTCILACCLYFSPVTPFIADIRQKGRQYGEEGNNGHT